MGIGLGSGRRWRLLAVAGAALLLAAGGVGAYALAGTQSGGGPARTTAPVARGTVTRAVAATGTVQPALTQGLGFSLAGTVTAVKVRPGDQVTAGQVLATIDDAAARDAVTRAEDALTAATKSLDTARTQADEAADLASTCGVAYASPAPQPSASASASPRPSASASPGPSGGPPDSPGPAATPTTRSGCSGGGANGGGANAGAARSSGSGVDGIFRAEQQVNNAQLQVDQARAQLEGTTIKAPAAGRVLTVAGGVGARVTAGGAFIQLSDVAKMQVQASFPEADAVRIASGQSATVTLADRPTPLPATVTGVDPVGTASGKLVTFGVRLAFKSAPADLLVGQSAGVQVQVAAAADVLSVPVSAVHDLTGNAGTVTVLLPGGRQERRQVGVGLVGDQSVEVTSGVSEGETVLTS
ncbi:efflux RND transporter periplasmic adaptor subunit [Rhizomonospora bruguierae]|uniref:efflux RND transporter periplasmic adaptor subunit n=1 Tax=Rhizomonospora bruguierae TaxID=1581705 RepID=UPI001BCCD367|nr:HlyD family efflux transporter periplasmic adaptor subunit [Micromonospora sp. NBRC 107566]